MSKRWILTTAVILAALAGLVVALTNWQYIKDQLQPIPPPTPCTPTAGVPSASSVAGLVVSTDASAGPVSVAYFASIGPHEITITNSDPSATVTITRVTLWESIDNTLKRKVDLPAGCTGYMGLSETNCIPPSGTGLIPPGGSCVSKLSFSKYQTGKLEVDTSLGTLTIPISVHP